LNPNHRKSGFWISIGSITTCIMLTDESDYQA